ncbi:MAG TPA: hypothetical protein VHC18_20835 [Amycolatopsis sp.]|nr:hypothetical protein [Amycolatopsis sp.]
MPRSRNKEIVSRFFERMNAGDLDGSLDLLTDDCTWFSLSSRRFSSKAEMRTMISRVNETVLRAPIVRTISVLTAEENRSPGCGNSTTLSTPGNSSHSTKRDRCRKETSDHEPSWLPGTRCSLMMARISFLFSLSDLATFSG